MTALACPEETTISLLIRGELDPSCSERVFAHLEVCDTCASILESLAAEASQANMATLMGPLSTFTREVRDRLAASPPSLPEGGRSAAIPREIPVIPGLTDLEPRSSGGMGIVYRAHDTALRRPVAVKLLWPAAGGSRSALARAKREAVVLACISHANVVAVYAAGEIDGSPYLVMEWIDGPSLQQRINAGLPTPRQAARIVRDLARALVLVHGLGIVHRDIKPANVLLAGAEAADWECCVPKLVDFGLARPAEITQQLTNDAAALGTPAYMSPEQTGLATELGEPGPATDIHALGGLAFALLTGSPPHEAATATATLHRAAASEVTWPHSRQFPRDLRAIIDCCLERQPARRYASAELLAEDLDRFIEGLPVRARPVSQLRRLARFAFRRPVLSLAVGLSLVFAAAALGGLAYHAATIAAARTQIARTQRLAEQTASVATRSMGQLTGDLIEQMVLRSRPDESGYVEFLRQIRDEFAGWPLGDNPAEAIRFRIKGLERVGGLFSDVSHFGDALTCQRLALASLDRLARLLPDDPTVLQKRLATLQLERLSLYQLGRVSEAEASARASISLLADASRETPRNELARIKMTLDQSIFLYEQGRVDEGAAGFDEALDAFGQLRQRFPNSREVLAKQTLAIFCAQQYDFNAGRLQECHQRLEQLVATMDGLLAVSPLATMTPRQRAAITSMFSHAYRLLAELAAQEGHLDEAIRLASRQHQLCQAYLAHLPEGAVDVIHRYLADADLRLAEWSRRQARADQATAALERAAKTASFLHNRQPGVWEHASLFAQVCLQRAEIAAACGERDAAAQHYHTVITLMEPQLAKDSHRTQTEACLAAARAGLGGLAGSPAEALR